jgi:hypothetical protein
VLPPSAKFANDPIPPPQPILKRVANVITRPFRPRVNDQIVIATSYNFLKSCISIGQLLFAISTLWLARGDQVQVFGYAAFGLTVAPYAWMSLVNLLGNAMCPGYPARYVVESWSLKMLREEVGRQDCATEFMIKGTVGEITPESEREVCSLYCKMIEKLFEETCLKKYLDYKLERITKLAGPLVVDGKAVRGVRIITLPGLPGRSATLLQRLSHFIGITAPIIIIGVISRFSNGDSALYQRVWVMMWVVFGSLLGPAFSSTVESSVESRNPIVSEHRPELRPLRSRLPEIVMAYIYLVLYATPAIGGFVVAGQTFLQYGRCFEI